MFTHEQENKNIVYSKELLLLNFTETRTDNQTDHDPRLYRPKVNKTTGLDLVISMVLVFGNLEMEAGRKK